MKLIDLSPEPLPDGLNLPEAVFIEAGAVGFIPYVVDRYLGKSVLCVADPDTWSACSESTRAELEADLRIEKFMLSRNPHADSETVEAIQSRGEGKTGFLAIGAGTVNDIVKMASTRLGIPYAVLGTAASMNGYASAIAAILSDGLKTTQPATPPRAILLDTDILRQAPPELTQAGLGDLLSKPVSMADYWLCSQVEGSEYNELAVRLADRAVDEVKQKASGLPVGRLASFEVLAKALVLSGICMVVAGSSSPASGGEHLIGHLWDMEILSEGRETRLHGAQVGVATCICAALYQRVTALDNPVFTEPPAWEAEEKRIRNEHGPWAEAVGDAYRVKHAKAPDRIQLLRDRWNEWRAELTAMKIPSPSEIRNTLASAGAPHTMKALGVSPQNAIETLRLARDIRDRYTVLDLAYETGIFPNEVESVLQESGTMDD